MTPAVKLLEKQKVSFTLHPYEHDSNETSFGDEAVRKLNLDARQVYKTLLVALNGEAKHLAVAVTPSLLSSTSRKWQKRSMQKSRDGRSHAGPAHHRLSGGRYQPAGPKKAPAYGDRQLGKRLCDLFISGGKRGLDIELSPQDLSRLLEAPLADIARRD